MYVHVQTDRINGPVVPINCPACGARAVPSQSYELIESGGILLRHATRWVTCGACGEALYSKLTLDALAEQSPAQLERWVVRRVGWPARLLGICSVAFCWAPILGPGLALGSWLANRRQRRGVARRSMILFALSLAWTVGLYVMIWLDSRAGGPRRY